MKIMKRVGIYSGTFDPVHNGHVSFALQAIDVAGLDEVVFLPEATPREKEGVTDISHRFELLKRSIGPFSNLSVRMLEVEQFCADDALPELLDIFDGDELWMLLGSDVVRTFSYRWKNLDAIFRDMAMIIAVREGDNAKDIKKAFKNLNCFWFIQVVLFGQKKTLGAGRCRKGNIWMVKILGRLLGVNSKKKRDSKLQEARGSNWVK